MAYYSIRGLLPTHQLVHSSTLFGRQRDLLVVRNMYHWTAIYSNLAASFLVHLQPMTHNKGQHIPWHYRKVADCAQMTSHSHSTDHCHILFR